MAEFIIKSEPTEQFNCDNESLGMSNKGAVFYSPSIGRRRCYRQDMENPQKGLKILSFKTEKRAQEVCDKTNEVSGGSGWKVEVLSYKYRISLTLKNKKSCQK